MSRMQMIELGAGRKHQIRAVQSARQQFQLRERTGPTGRFESDAAASGNPIYGRPLGRFPFLRSAAFGRRIALNPFRGEGQGKQDE